MSNDDTSRTGITIDRIAADYAKPGEKIVVPTNALEQGTPTIIVDEPVVDSYYGDQPPEEISYEATRAPDIAVVDDEIIEVPEAIDKLSGKDLRDYVDTRVAAANAILEQIEETTTEPTVEDVVSIPVVEELEIIKETSNGVTMDLEPEAIPEIPLDRFQDLDVVVEQAKETVLSSTDLIEETPILATPEDKPIPTEEVLEKPEIPNHNFNMKWNPKFKAKDLPADRNLFNELPVMPGNFDEFNYHAQQADDKVEYKSEQERLWLAYVKEGSSLFHEYRNFDKTLTREGSAWEQAIESEVGPLGLSRPNFGKNNNNVLTGEKAILKMSSIMNLGQLLSVPLWHSGIWIKLKAPSDAALLALENRIAEEMTLLGRQTTGFIFSNSSSYIYDYLVNLILSCVYDTSYSKPSPEELRKIIKINDIPTLVWGFLCTIYPNGYPLAQPCINNIGSCVNIEHEMISISKLMWVDKSTLSPGQIKHMTKRDKVMTDEEIAKYQEELNVGGDKLIHIKDNLSILLSVPTIQEYIDSGYKWVEGIERMVAQSFAAAKQGEDRNQYILTMSKTMSLRQYTHFIKEVQFTDDPTDPDSTNYLRDKDTIEDAMDTLSKDLEIADMIVEKVSNYIDSTTMAVVGIPKYSCPVCGTDQGKFLPEDKYIIPLDVVRIFFTLQNQRLLKVTLSMSE